MSVSKANFIELEIKKARSDTARAISVLNRGFYAYFVFILFAVLGFINNLIGRDVLNILIILGIVSLLVGVIPYFRIFANTQKSIEGLIKNVE